MWNEQESKVGHELHLSYHSSRRLVLQVLQSEPGNVSLVLDMTRPN